MVVVKYLARCAMRHVGVRVCVAARVVALAHAVRVVRRGRRVAARWRCTGTLRTLLHCLALYLDIVKLNAIVLSLMIFSTLKELHVVAGAYSFFYNCKTTYNFYLSLVYSDSFSITVSNKI